jgi:pyruvate formate lyase activating enzyme
MKEAMFYNVLRANKIQCNLCNHRCKIPNGEVGICGVRKNVQGRLYSLVYGKIISANIDPIEKKPLFNFLPGSKAFSIGTVGCNFHCRHCQNSDISQYPREHNGQIIGEDHTPEQIVAAAKAANCEVIAYTYNEPTVFYEFAYDTSILAHEAGIKNIFVSNGYLSGQAARKIGPYLDGINIDLKSFNDKTYTSLCAGHLKPVLETIRRMKNLGVWVEVTTLIIPGINDTEEELRNSAYFLKNIGAEVPWHVTRFHPAYKLQDRSPTPLATLRRARQIGMQEKLRYVYAGNLMDTESENTHCFSCGTLLIRRNGMAITQNRLRNGKCPQCRTKIDGVTRCGRKGNKHLNRY